MSFGTTIHWGGVEHPPVGQDTVATVENARESTSPELPRGESPDEPSQAAARSVRITSGLRKTPKPLYAIAANPVVRPAREAPVSNRRIQGDGLAVKSQLPSFGVYRSYHLVSTSATAHVYCNGVAHGHISHAIIQFVREVVGEHVPDGGDPRHSIDPRWPENCQ